MPSITLAVSDADHRVPGFAVEAIEDLFCMQDPVVRRWVEQNRPPDGSGGWVLVADPEWVNRGDGTQSVTFPVVERDAEIIAAIRAKIGTSCRPADSPGDPAAAPKFTVEIQWSADDQAYAARFLRDGEPWILNGALVGMGGTRGAAVDNLAGIARYLVIHGENGLTGPLPVIDREWLFGLLDDGADLNDDMYAAIQAARRAAGKD